MKVWKYIKKEKDFVNNEVSTKKDDLNESKKSSSNSKEDIKNSIKEELLNEDSSKTKTNTSENTLSENLTEKMKNLQHLKIEQEVLAIKLNMIQNCRRRA